MEDYKLTNRESELIRKYTTVKDWKYAAEVYQVSVSTIQNLIYQRTRKTIYNRNALDLIKNKAIENCRKRAKEHDRDQIDLLMI